MPVTVQDIMTNDVIYFPQNATIHSAKQTMEEEKFDVAPVKAGGYFQKFVEYEDLAASDETNKVIRVSKSMHEKHFVGKEVPVLVLDSQGEDLLGIFADRDQHFAFVIEDGVVGIVTFADLNKSIAGTAFYHLISVFEDRIASIVDSEVPHDVWLEHFSDDKQNEIESRFKQGKKENADLRLVNFLTTGELREILLAYDLWEALGFESQERAQEIIKEIEEIRHSVMHPRPIVGKNSISELDEIMNKTKQIIQRTN